MNQYKSYIVYFLISAILSGIFYADMGVYDLGNLICWMLTTQYFFKTERNLFLRFFCVLCSILAAVHLVIDTIAYHSTWSHTSFYLYYDIPNYLAWMVVFIWMIDNALWLRNEKFRDRVLFMTINTSLVGLAAFCIIELFLSGAGGNGLFRYLLLAPMVYFLAKYYDDKEKAG